MDVSPRAEVNLPRIYFYPFPVDIQFAYLKTLISATMLITPI